MLNCKDISILLIYGFILFKVLKPTQTKEMILLTLVAYMLLAYEGFGEGFTEEVEISANDSPNGSTNGSANGLTNGSVNGSVKESAPKIQSKDNIEPTKKEDAASQSNMGPYDGICLKTGNKEYWMKSPDNTDLIPNDELYSYLGSQGPVKMRLSDQAALIGPPIDGVKGSAEKKFMFANNKTSLACCPSTFSTSTGCVCTTENQRDFIAGRGIIDGDNKNEI